MPERDVGKRLGKGIRPDSPQTADMNIPFPPGCGSPKRGEMTRGQHRNAALHPRLRSLGRFRIATGDARLEVVPDFIGALPEPPRAQIPLAQKRHGSDDQTGVFLRREGKERRQVLAIGPRGKSGNHPDTDRPQELPRSLQMRRRIVIPRDDCHTTAAGARSVQGREKVEIEPNGGLRRRGRIEHISRDDQSVRIQRNQCAPEKFEETPVFLGAVEVAHRFPHVPVRRMHNAKRPRRLRHRRERHGRADGVIW